VVTPISDKSWRHVAFKVKDYITPTSLVRIRFIVEDAGFNSLVEAAVDDLALWEFDLIGTGVQEPLTNQDVIKIYPNPSTGDFNIWLTDKSITTIALYDLLGKKVFGKEIPFGEQQQHIDTDQLSEGTYIFKAQSGSVIHTQKVSLIRP